MGSDPLSGDEEATANQGCQHRSATRRSAGLAQLRPSHGGPFGHHATAHRSIALWRIWPSASFHDLYIAEPVSRGDGGSTKIYAKPLGDGIDLCSSVWWKQRSSERLRPDSKLDFATLGQPRRAFSRGDYIFQFGARDTP